MLEILYLSYSYMCICVLLLLLRQNIFYISNSVVPFYFLYNVRISPPPPRLKWSFYRGTGSGEKSWP